MVAAALTLVPVLASAQAPPLTRTPPSPSTEAQPPPLQVASPTTAAPAAPTAPPAAPTASPPPPAEPSIIRPQMAETVHPHAPDEMQLEGEPRYWTPYPRPAPQEFPEPPPEHDTIDPRVRHNIFGQKISPEWDPEKIINTDRPDFTDVLPTVGKHVWQSESGASFRHRVGPDYTLNRSSLPETTLRLGLTERFELRIKWDSFLFSQRSGAAAEGTAGKSAYGSDFLIGFKWMAVPQAGWLPGHTLLGTLTTRMGSGGPAQTLIQPGINWVYGWQINKWLVVRGSTGVEFVVVEPQRAPGQPAPNALEPGSPRTIFDLHQSVVSYMQVFKRLGMYVEWFSFYDFGAERLQQHNGGVGLYIYLTPNIQIDLRGGSTIAGNVRETFTGAGISFRGKYKYKKRR